jgi:hypothetical protein
MMKTFSLAGALLFSLATAVPSAATMNVTVSGQTVIGILDTDMDGMPDPPDDCSFKASLSGGSNLLVDGMIGTGIALQGCTGDYMGTTSANGSIGINFTSAPGVVGFVQLPTMVNFFNGGGGGGAGVAMSPSQVTIEFEDGTPIEETAGAMICSNGGPAVIVRTTDGTTVLFALEFYPDAANPTYLKAPNIPISNAMGQTVFVDGYIPVTPDRKITVTVGTGDPVVEIALDELQPCGGPAVPTMNEWGLIALMVALLAGGVWVLRRRRSFAGSLSML